MPVHHRLEPGLTRTTNARLAGAMFLAYIAIGLTKEGKGNFGYNAASREYGDIVEMGVLDPTKVTRTALQNAASGASLMLTTDCMVAELAEDKPAAGGMPGGMGGMGGMGMDM